MQKLYNPMQKPQELGFGGWGLNESVRIQPRLNRRLDVRRILRIRDFDRVKNGFLGLNFDGMALKEEEKRGSNPTPLYRERSLQAAEFKYILVYLSNLKGGI